MKVRFCVLALIFLPIILLAQSSNLALNVDDVVSKMTLEQKAKLVVGMGMRFPGAPQTTAPVVGQTEEKVPGAAGSTFAIPELGVPSMVVADGPAGLRIAPIRGNDSSKTYYATAFPIATLLASTWDTSLVRKVGYTIGNEVLEYGVDIILMPALNLHRNPLCGRNFEYYSEDPLITGSIAAAMVKGLQSNGIGTSIKHFAANNQETNRFNINTIVSERALRELYLKGFEIAVKRSYPWTVMSSYNKINGVYTSESYDLLTLILRNDWDFKGFVMTDWFGGKDPVAQMQAGNDLLMPGRPEQSQSIIEAVNNGTLDVKVLDQNVKRILNIVSKSQAFKKYPYSNKPDLKAHAQVARMAATEGMVLLKNENNALPLKNEKRLALFGNSSYDLIVGGTGSGDVNEAYSVSIEKGLLDAGYTLDDSLRHLYLKYLKEERAKQPKPRRFRVPSPIPQMSIPVNTIDKIAEKAEVAIVTIGRISGEFRDRKIEGDFYLDAVEQELLENVSSAFHAKGKKVIVLLNIGGVIEVASWRDKVDAILLAWQPGQEGGNALADVLSGKVNPSGKLATTFPMKYEDVPSAKNFPGTPQDKPEKVVYEEGIYVGYRYFNTFNITPAYEFGYGLSYTDFSYGKVRLNSKIFKEKLTVTLTITNTGKVAGKEIVELYISAPGTKLAKPVSELKGYAKTKLLKPGASETISFIITAQDLASFDTSTTSWLAEKWDYILKVGASSMDIKQEASFQLPGDLVVEKLNKALTPQEEIRELEKL
jgi:beta-glucosidase